MRRASSPRRSSTTVSGRMSSSRSRAAGCCWPAPSPTRSASRLRRLNVEFYTGVETTLPEPVVLPPMLDGASLAGKSVLLVDDVSDSGRTLALVLQLLQAGRRRGAHGRALHEAGHGAEADYTWRRTDLWITFPWSDAAGDPPDRARDCRSRSPSSSRRTGPRRSSRSRPNRRDGRLPARRDRGRAAATCRRATACCGRSRAPLADVRVLIVGQDPYPTPGHPIGLSFAVERDVRPIPRSLQNIYRELRDDLGIPPVAARRPQRVGGAGRHAAQPGAHGAGRGLRLAPRQGLGGGHRGGHPRARRPRRSARRDPVGAGCRVRSRPCSVRHRSSRPRTRARSRRRPDSSARKPFSRANELLGAAGRSTGRLAARSP